MVSFYIYINLCLDYLYGCSGSGRKIAQFRLKKSISSAHVRIQYVPKLKWGYSKYQLTQNNCQFLQIF